MSGGPREATCAHVAVCCARRAHGDRSPACQARRRGHGCRAGVAAGRSARAVRSGADRLHDRRRGGHGRARVWAGVGPPRLPGYHTTSGEHASRPPGLPRCSAGTSDAVYRAYTRGAPVRLSASAAGLPTSPCAGWRARAHALQLWLYSHDNLFTKPCERCRQLLQLDSQARRFLPPLERHWDASRYVHVALHTRCQTR